MAGFQDIIGHEQIIAHFKKAIAMDKVSHAYILDGPEHAGKRMLAEAFAMTLQCETVQRVCSGAEETAEQVTLFSLPEETDFGVSQAARARAAATEPCMECRSCVQALGKNQPDIIYVTHVKTGISVDDIREQVNADICVKPYSSRYKVYIIDEAETMTVQAQNALLKTLEEPPAYAVILLLTTNADAFLPTIRSRCVRLGLKAAKDEQIRAFLMQRCRVPDYQADISIAFAQGNVGQARLLASSEQFNEIKDYTLRLVRRVREMTVGDLTGELRFLTENRENIPVFLDLILLLFRDVLLYKSTAAGEDLIFKEQAFLIQEIAGRISYRGLNRILQSVETAGRRIEANVNLSLTMELLLIDIKENII
ncbi:MAG: DNA polymerase III subunit delta [Clostridiales bacterium]|nr:DNA polymerase III subunit delta [Clostridiales bacterium]